VTAAARAVFVAVLVGATVSHAHVVYGEKTLRQLTLESDLVVRARIVDPAAEVRIGESERETVVVGKILEALAGTPGADEVRFAQHAHGAPLYEKGDEVLVFLQRTAHGGAPTSRGLAASIRFVSIQESGERFALDARNRAAFAAAVRAYAGLEQRPPDARLDALRRITVELLGSPQPEIAASALRDLVIARDFPLVTRDDLPVLEPLLANGQTPIGVRIGLLAELERRRLVDAPPRWAALVRTARGDDRIAVVRAAGAHPSDPVAAELAPLLEGPDPQLVAAAAMALGAPGRESAVPRLAPLLGSPDARVRAAAVRGLGRIGTASAGEALANAAASHPDPSTRRHARAELQGIERSRAQ
jgi:hypothetical protein